MLLFQLGPITKWFPSCGPWVTGGVWGPERLSLGLLGACAAKWANLRSLLAPNWSSFRSRGYLVQVQGAIMSWNGATCGETFLPFYLQETPWRRSTLPLSPLCMPLAPGQSHVATPVTTAGIIKFWKLLCNRLMQLASKKFLILWYPIRENK